MVTTGENSPDEAKDLDFLDILLVIARNKRTVVRSTITFFVVGLVMAISIPNRYTSTVSLIKDDDSSASGSLRNLSLLRGLGVDLGGSDQGLTTNIYPALLLSHEVLLSAANANIYFPDIGDSMSFVDYMTGPPGLFNMFISGIKKVTIKLPNTLKMLLTGGGNARPLGANLQLPTEEEIEVIIGLEDMVSINISQETGLINLAVTSYNAMVSYQIVNILAAQLKSRVREILTEKERENWAFIKARLDTSEKELLAAEDAPADRTRSRRFWLPGMN